MGMSNGTIMDHEISGSSTIDKAHPAFYARVITARNERVSTRGSWCAKLTDKEQFLEVDLKTPRKVTGQLLLWNEYCSVGVASCMAWHGLRNFLFSVKPLFTQNDHIHLKWCQQNKRWWRLRPRKWHCVLSCRGWLLHGYQLWFTRKLWSCQLFRLQWLPWVL